MSPEDIKKLLGGYATGTLTDREQEALFAAALEDQELFDALAREQSLRDLLRDPAARAELLSALDTPVDRFGGFWQWLRRPAVAGLAAAGVVTIAVVAVWTGTRLRSPQLADRVMVADLRSQDAAPSPSPARSTTPPPAQPAPRQLAKQTKAAPVRRSDSVQALTESRAEADSQLAVLADKKEAMPAPPPPPPQAAMPALMARKAETESTAAAQSAGAISGAVKEMAAVDARGIFYGNLPAPGANAFVAPKAKDAADLAAPLTAATLRLGVRVSVLRAAGEVDVTTPLDPGETVRLKLIPNADGFLYVAEGAHVLASGAAQRLKPFETPELRLEGSGQKQLVVTLSRRPENGPALSIGALTRDNLVENSADQNRATYVVSGPRQVSAPRVVVPVTLTWR